MSGARSPELVTLSFDELVGRAAHVLAAHGVPPADARRVAHTFVASEAEGASSHGLSRLPHLVGRLRAGLVEPTTRTEVVRSTPATAVIDAHHGIGQIVAERAMAHAVSNAKKLGLGAVSVRRSTHLGRAGHPALLAAEQGLVGLAATNGSPRVVPGDGAVPVLGNNPWAIAWPSADGPYCLDLANSLVAAGKIRSAQLEGRSIPAGWALDNEGAPTTDPTAALRGALVAMGGHKGWGISLAVDVLAGGLSEGGMGRDVHPIDDLTERQNVSHFFMAIDIAAFGDLETFNDRMASFASLLRDESGPNARLPGENSRLGLARSQEAGVAVGVRALQLLEELENELGS